MVSINNACHFVSIFFLKRQECWCGGVDDCGGQGIMGAGGSAVKASRESKQDKGWKINRNFS